LVDPDDVPRAGAAGGENLIDIVEEPLGFAPRL
jgi:hypothetical protein